MLDKYLKLIECDDIYVPEELEINEDFFMDIGTYLDQLEQLKDLYSISLEYHDTYYKGFFIGTDLLEICKQYYKENQ